MRGDINEGGCGQELLKGYKYEGGCGQERRFIQREGEGENTKERKRRGVEGGREEEDKCVCVWTSFTLFHT